HEPGPLGPGTYMDAEGLQEAAPRLGSRPLRVLLGEVHGAQRTRTRDVGRRLQLGRRVPLGYARRASRTVGTCSTGPSGAERSVTCRAKTSGRSRRGG